MRRIIYINKLYFATRFSVIVEVSKAYFDWVFHFNHNMDMNFDLVLLFLVKSRVVMIFDKLMSRSYIREASFSCPSAIFALRFSKLITFRVIFWRTL